MHSVNNVFISCGFDVYSNNVNLGKTTWLINKGLLQPYPAVQKLSNFLASFRQLSSFLYTSFVQYYAIFVSVKSLFVHNFHIPYIYIKKLNELFINLITSRKILAPQNTKGLII